MAEPFVTFQQQLQPTADGSYSTLNVGDVGGGNYAEIESDGSLELHGNATYFEDDKIDGINISPGSGVSMSQYTGSIKRYTFPGNTNTEGYFGIQLRHARKLNSNITPHIHIAAMVNPNTQSAAVFKLEWAIQEIGATPTTGSSTKTVTVGTTDAMKHKILDFDAITGTYGLSTIISCTLSRLTNDAADDYGEQIALLSVDVHVECDTLGSRQITTK